MKHARIRWRKTDWGWRCRVLELEADVHNNPVSWFIFTQDTPAREVASDVQFSRWQTGRSAKIACTARLRLLEDWLYANKDRLV